MTKAPILASLVLGAFSILVCRTVNAVTLELDWHKWNWAECFWCPDEPFSTINDGSHTAGHPASDVTWEWDGAVLTSSGLYSPVWAYRGSSTGVIFLNDRITDLAIDTATSTATAETYVCVEGDYGSRTEYSLCGGYSFGANILDESTIIFGPGTSVSRTIGGDDEALSESSRGAKPFFPPYPRSISAYDYSLLSWDGTTLIIGNGVPIDTSGGQAMQFSVAPIPIPPAVWLFGSALGVMGWMRRKAAA